MKSKQTLFTNWNIEQTHNNGHENRKSNDEFLNSDRNCSMKNLDENNMHENNVTKDVENENISIKRYPSRHIIERKQCTVNSNENHGRPEKASDNCLNKENKNDDQLVPNLDADDACDTSVSSNSFQNAKNKDHKLFLENKKQSNLLIPKRIIINVSGSIFETYEATLNRFPVSLLGNQKSRLPYYCQLTNQYYFNRNRKIFESILFFYQSNGKLYRPNNTNLILFLEECRFFQLPEKLIDVVKEVECGFLTDKVNAARELKGFTCDSQYQAAAWRFLEYPDSSKYAKVYFVTQMTFILISIGLFSSESLTNHNAMTHSLENQFLIAELFISIIFALDFIARCLFCPNKKKHFLSMYTYIDLVCLVPYSMMTSTDDNELNTLGRLLKMVRFLRVLKLIRLSTRISQKLRILFVIINDSWRDLQIFALGILLIVFFSAAIVYVFEVNEEDTKFTSIPMSMWWSLQASITLGYGDIVPQTFLGRLVSSIYMIYGLIWMMLPILALGLKVVVFGAEVREMKA